MAHPPGSGTVIADHGESIERWTDGPQLGVAWALAGDVMTLRRLGMRVHVTLHGAVLVMGCSRGSLSRQLLPSKESIFDVTPRVP
jgi:hypothetical protein